MTQIIIPRGELKEAVAGFSKIVNGKTTLPILSCVRFENTGKGIIAQATDLDQAVRYRFSGAQAQHKGVLIVPLANLKELAKGNDAETVEFEAGENSSVTITNHVGAHAVKHPVAGADPDEWPVCPEEITTKPAEGFLDTYRRLVPFASTDPTRYIINGVYIEVADKGEHPVTMVATDGRRLSLWNSMNLPVAQSVIIPTTKFLQWSGLDGDVAIGIRTERQKKEVRVLGLALSIGPWFYSVRAIEGAFPNFRQVIPSAIDSGPNRITFTDEDVTGLRKIIPTFPGSGVNGVDIALRQGSDGKLVIAGRGKDDKKDTTLELTGGSKFEGSIHGIGVNGAFLLDALNAGFRTFTTSDEQNALRSEDGKGGIHVLMPLRSTEPVKPQVPQPQPENDSGKGEMCNKVTDTPEGNTTPPAATTEEKKTMASETTEGTEKGTALERVQAAYEIAKTKIREANQALADVAAAIKEAVKENKQLKGDVENVRAGLQKLQQIKV